MTDFSPERCAAALLGQRRQPPGTRRPMAPLPPGARPGTVAEGIAGQVALAHLTDAAAPAGFKIGATGTRMQAFLKLDGPAAAFMPRDSLLASGSTLSFAQFLRPSVECELAVHLSRDLPPRAHTAAEVAEAVDLLMAAIELVENRYEDLAVFGTPSMIADQVFHTAAILGEPSRDVQALDLPSLQGTMLLDGAVVGEGEGRELLGHPMAALAWLAGSAEAAAFGGLRAGQVVMLGSVIPPVWLDAPGTVEVRFPPLAPVVLNLV